LLVDVGSARLLVLGIAIASIVLAAVAAFVQDDLEHVLGYSIVGDAGVVVLALATLDPEAWAPARTWILIFVVARSAFAAWVAGVRAGMWTGRIADLRGWVWRSPVLAFAFVLVVIASVGFPGLVAYDVRESIVDLALEPPLAGLILFATLLPLGYYGRLAAIGLARPERVGDPRGTWMPRLTRPDLTGMGAWVRDGWEVNRAFTTAAVAVLLGLLALATSAGGFGGPEAAAGLPPTIGGPGEIVAPNDSVEP
jgi:formate hydrogenlyase subunit 3/multisubunit Na+/H+ antiporter MnhD subunit